MSATSPLTSNLYATDYHAWAYEQAALLRAGRLTEADIRNIAEEIESMGRNERRELTSRLSVLLLQLLKWRYQPTFRSNSWRFTIEERRFQVGDHLKSNPSLKLQLIDAMTSAYRVARIGAVQETGFDRDLFPQACPFTFDEAMRPDFWPE
jgi:hypothetical protein